MILQSKNIWINEQFQQGQLVIEKDKIIDIVPYDTYTPDEDYQEEWILPGFIDIHSHGYNGIHANYPTIEGLKLWNQALPKEGVTSYLLTTSTADWQDLLVAYPILNKFIESNPCSAQPMGIHVEGPFISTLYKGAHNEDKIQPLKPELLAELMALAPNKIKMIALAVENDPNYCMTKYCVDHHLVVALGHSGASLDQIENARKLGAKDFTHTFNAMTSLHHRDLNMAGAAMTMDDMYAEVIADGYHVNIDLVKVLARAKGKDHLIAITDAVSIKGLPPGEYHLKNRDVRIDENGIGHLPNGKLAGSSNCMNRMLYNLIYIAKAPLVTCINAVSKNPAALMGWKSKGQIQVGNDADITIVTPQIEVICTYSRGKCVYKKSE